MYMPNDTNVPLLLLWETEQALSAFQFRFEEYRSARMTPIPR